MATKHQQILQYIEQLPIGDKISVRSIAKHLTVSEGTAYRAIKAAENSGLVSTIERVGTIRIEQNLTGEIENLTFNDIIKVIDGQVLGGQEGLDKLLDKFVIGAMRVDAITRYITPKSLMIVGNRDDVQQLALQNGAAVLITGGFKTSRAVIELANQLALPVLSTDYDTYTVSAMINRALTNQMIKKEIKTVNDVYRPLEAINYLTTKATVADYKDLVSQVKKNRFPVVNSKNRLVGIVTPKDIQKKAVNLSIEKVMTKEPTSVKTYMSLASVGHTLTWNSLEVLPVVSDNFELIGLLTKKDVMQSLQGAKRQMQMTETFYDQIADDLTASTQNERMGSFKAVISPQMTNSFGTLSFGVLSELITLSCQQYLELNYQKNVVIEQVNLHYLKMIQLESTVEFVVTVLEIGRRSAKLDVNILVNHTLFAKAIVASQILERT